MGGTRTVLYALLVLVLLVVALLVVAGLGSRDEQDAAARDASIVFCTAAPARVEGLVNAAVSLGLAKPGSTPADITPAAGPAMPYARWRAEDTADFQRACGAYAAANLPAASGAGSQASGLESVLDILLPVIAGALLTLAGDDIRQAAGRRWAAADEVRAAWREFDAAVRAFVKTCEDSPGGGLPSLSAVDETRRRLQDVLRKTGTRYPRYAALRRLAQDVGDEVLGPSAFMPGWDPDTEAGSVRTCLAAGEESAAALADRLERGIRLPSVRRRAGA